MSSMTKTVIEALFRQYPAAREIRDFVLMSIKDSGMPAEIPTVALCEPGARGPGVEEGDSKLVVKFREGQTFRVSLCIEDTSPPKEST